jgi:4'-phosphopantetheinyl transferase EntD
VDCPHGTIVIGGAAGELHPSERAQVAALPPHRQREFHAGRSVLRAALGLDIAIPTDDRGAPVMPAGWVGSLSHKGYLAAALVAPDSGARVGIDIEHARRSNQPIERHVLGERERAAITGVRVTLAFAIKEAIYKAIDPFVRRYVKFTEVELSLGDAGRCEVTTALPFRIEAWWCEHEAYWLATAVVTPIR